MKVVIDLVEDLRENIKDDEEFIIGAIAIEKELDSEENALLAWGKAITRLSVDTEKKRLNFYVEDGQVLHVDELLRAVKAMKNEEMMYEIFLSTKEHPSNATAPLIGFNEDTLTKQFMLIIEE